MKKFFMMAAVAVSMVLASCSNGVEAKAQDFVKQEVEAIANGDFSKIIEISKEVEKYTNSLSEEDKKIFIEAMQKFTEEHKAELGGALQNGLKNGLQNGVDGLKGLFK